MAFACRLCAWRNGFTADLISPVFVGWGGDPGVTQEAHDSPGSRQDWKITHFVIA
jgi:hypothetical protein